jgi:hypothetical protein
MLRRFSEVKPRPGQLVIKWSLHHQFLSFEPTIPLATRLAMMAIGMRRYRN